MSALKWVYLRLACTCEETCLSVWPPNASFYASSTCRYLRPLASPFGQGLLKSTLNFKNMIITVRQNPLSDLADKQKVNSYSETSRRSCRYIKDSLHWREQERAKVRSDISSRTLSVPRSEQSREKL